MAEPPTVTTAEPKDKKHRSPAYPFISLEAAIARAKQTWEKDRQHSSPIAVAATHWGYGAKSSGGLQTVSALKQFGLMEEEGGGPPRKVKLTELAKKILLDEVHGSPQRAAAIKKAALSPKLYAELWQKWGSNLPSDEAFRTYLRLEREFNEMAVQAVLDSYKDTITFAKLEESDRIGVEGEPQDQPTKIAPGDFVQWESAGVLQFIDPRRVTGVSGDFVFVEDSKTGIPMTQVTKTDPPTPPLGLPPQFPPATDGIGKPLQSLIPPMNWVLSVPRGVRAQLIITGSEVKAEDLRRLKAQIDFLVDSFTDESR